MRATRSIVQILAFALAAAVGLAGVTASPALAAPLPTDNLVRNGDEGPLVSPTGGDVVTTIVSWAEPRPRVRPSCATARRAFQPPPRPR
jgi:hypothetical protein